MNLILLCDMIIWSQSICIQNLGLNCTNGSWDTKQNEIWPLTFICITKNGLISIPSYYAIWLSRHTPYAYKIWAQSDQGFLRYKTKWDLTFDLHLHNQDGVISMCCYYIIWLSNNITYACQIWDPSALWFLRYKTKGKCVWAYVRVCISCAY